MLGAILQSAARNLAMILVGRIIAGWAVGETPFKAMLVMMVERLNKSQA